MPPRKPRVSLTCVQCGKAFELLECQMGRGRGRFCSKACGGLAKRTGSELFCAWCDATFYRHPSEQDMGKRVNQFCSRPCYMAWRAANRSPRTYPKIGQTHTHRLVAETVLGRPLAAGEVVHHIDLNKHNCDPSNLAVFPDQATHVRCHAGKMPHDELRRFSLV
jgi:hypothetical protein